MVITALQDSIRLCVYLQPGDNENTWLSSIFITLNWPPLSCEAVDEGYVVAKTISPIFLSGQ